MITKNQMTFEQYWKERRAYVERTMGKRVYFTSEGADEAEEAFDFQQKRIDKLEVALHKSAELLLQRVSRNGQLEAALKVAEEALSLMDCHGKKAKAISAPEDVIIKELCENIGYGAVMDSAARQWFLKDPIGSHTHGPCALTVRQALKAIQEARK